MDLTSANGHLEIVIFVHLIGKDCSKTAMTWASYNGHLEIVNILIPLVRIVVIMRWIGLVDMVI
jgi:hypothetical protein